MVNALRAVALLVDAAGGQPPGDILSRIKELREDPVSDVQSAATALLDKVSRLGPS